MEGEVFSDIEGIEEFIMTGECDDHEQAFKRFVLSRFEQSSQQWQQALECNQTIDSPQDNCLEDRDAFNELLKSVDNYKAIKSQIYQTLAQNWLDSIRPELKAAAENCFVFPDENGAGFQFDGNFRILRNRPDIDASLCVGIRGMWEEQLGEAESRARNNPESVGLLEEDILFLDEFDSSFAGYLLSDDSKNNPNHTEAEQREAILADIRLGIQNIQDHRNDIENWNGNRLHRLYQFRSLYEDQFVSSLPANIREVTFPRCRRESNFSCARVTVPGLQARLEDFGRCASQSLEILGEVVPIYGVFDAFQELGRTRASYLAGAINEEERAARNSSSAISLVFGVPIVPATGAALSRVGAGLLARQGARLPRQVFSPTRLDDLPENIPQAIRERIESGYLRLSQENPIVINEGNGAFLFHGSSSRSLTAFGANSRAGGLRPTGELRGLGIEPLSGELGAGASARGINQEFLSSVDLSGFDNAVRYTRIATGSSGSERALQGVTQEQAENSIRNLIRELGMPDTPESRNQIVEAFGIRAIEPADLSRFSGVERGFINEEFPILYGLRPQGELQGRLIGQGNGLPTNITGEAAIRGGVSFDEIRSIFVPPERVREVREFLLESGVDSRINVVPYNFN